jgi:hypothetical protein
VAITLADIKRLKSKARRELEEARKVVDDKEKRLETVERFEAMFTGNPLPSNSRSTRTADSSPRTRLRDLVLGIIGHADHPLSPQEIVNLAIEQGYSFTSPRNGLGSVTSVLSRKKGKGVHKLADGKWTANK